MSKNHRNIKKLNNEGFSLVEVLVAVIILALVAGPILMAFVMSARFNARARENQRISTVAESVMEEFKGFSIKDAKANYEDISAPGSGTYRFANTKTIDGGTYDIRVTATPIRDKEAAVLNGADTSKDSYIKAAPMDPYYDYVYTQDLYQDKRIYDQILNDVYTYLDDNYDFSTTDPGKSASDLNKDKINVNRTVVAEITGSDTDQAVKMLFIYDFNISNYPITGHSSVSYSFPYTITEESAVKYYKELNNVYLFYSPGYNSIPAKKVAQIKSDTVIIANHSSRAINAYVTKQVNPLYSDADRFTCDTEYRPNIYPAGAGAVNLVTHINDTDSVEGFNNHSHDSLMYSVKVEVFESGAKAAGFPGTALYTLDGSINSKENDD